MKNSWEILRNFDKYDAYVKDKTATGIETNRKGWAEITVTDTDGKPLAGATVRAVQKTHAFRYGANLFMLDELESAEKNAAYKAYFKDCFNMATLPFYWSDLEPEPGAVRYDKNSKKIYRRPPTDLCMEFCEQNGIEPREHALAYDHFFPDWLVGADDATVKRAFEKRCAEIASRYADRIPTIEVTNEMFWENGKTAFYKNPDFVNWCFRTASHYFPHNKLGINEWSDIWVNRTATEAYYNIIRNALLQGAGIDAIGIQFHMFMQREKALAETARYYNPRQLYGTMDLFAGLGLPIQITEVTIPAYSEAPEDEAMQAEILEKLYQIWFSHPSVEQIIYWNLVDGYAAFAPRGDMTVGENYYHGGLLRFDMTPKPAYTTIKNLFEKVWHTDVTTGTDVDGTALYKGFFGDYEIMVTAENKSLTRTIRLQKGAENRFTVTLPTNP